MRDEPGWNTHKHNRAHTSRQELGSRVKCWVLRIWWTQPVPFSSISSSDHLAPQLLWGPWPQLCLCGPTAPASPWHAWSEDHERQNISLCLGSFWGTFGEIVAVLWSRGEPGPSLLLFNQSSAGWVKINDLWVLAMTGAYSSQSRAPLPPNVTFNEPISPQWRGRHLKLLFTLHSLLISHS